MKYKERLLSIIIPVYNVEPYVSKCLESVRNQTYPYLDIIIVDDGSTDGSGQICDFYQKIDKRIRVFHKKNGGSSSARNLGLRYAKGEFIGFVDSDDFIDLDMYESMLHEMTGDVDIVICSRYINYPKEKHCRDRVAFHTSKHVEMDNITAIEEFLKHERLSFGVYDKVYRRELFQSVSFPVGRVSEDIPVVYTLLKKCKKVVHIGKPKYHNFHRDGSISRQGFYPRKIDHALFMGQVCKDVAEKYPQLLMQAEALYLTHVCRTIRRIQSCSERFQYGEMEKRLIKVLCHMCIRFLRNPCISNERKLMIFSCIRSNCFSLINIV